MLRGPRQLGGSYGVEITRAAGNGPWTGGAGLATAVRHGYQGTRLASSKLFKFCRVVCTLAVSAAACM